MHCFYYIFPCFKIHGCDASPTKAQYMRHGREGQHRVRMAYKIGKTRKHKRLTIQ